MKMNTSLDHIMRIIFCLVIILLLHYNPQFHQNFTCHCQPTKSFANNRLNSSENLFKNIFIHRAKATIQPFPDLGTNEDQEEGTNQTDDSISEPKIQLEIDKLNPNHFVLAFLMNGTLQKEGNETHKISVNRSYTISDNTSLRLQDISIHRASVTPNHLNHNFLVISVDLNITDENSTMTKNFNKSIILPDVIDLSNQNTSLDVSIEGMVPLTFKIPNNETNVVDYNITSTSTNKPRDDIEYRNSSLYYITPIYFSRVRLSDSTPPMTLSPIKKCKSSNIQALTMLRTYFVSFVVITTLILFLSSISLFGKYYVESRRRLSYNCWMLKEKDDKKILKNSTTCL